MVQYQELFNLVHGDTFSPFRIFTTDGRIVDIVRKFNNVVTSKRIVIGIPRPNDPHPFPSAVDTVELPLETIDRVEFLPAILPTMPR